MTYSFEMLDRQIPYYLTEHQRGCLKNALAGFTSGASVSIVSRQDEHTLLQGDGWRELTVFNFSNGERMNVKGIVLSNSCDVSSGNSRDITAKIVFSPIIKLSNYISRLKRSGVSQDGISSKVDAIRRQHVSNIFHIPSNSYLEEEYISLLDDVHSMPLDVFHRNEGAEKLFSLTMVGFYIFVLKLSVHFCRMHEEVERVA